MSGTIFYIDLEKIRKHDGYVYYWELVDYLKPINGVWSAKVYKQGNCKQFRFKFLSFSFYKDPMGNGTADTSNAIDKNWIYPPPISSAETVLKTVCSQ